MRPTSYLLPARQRTIARFMNLSPTVDWLVRMQKNFPLPSTEEKEVFSFVNHYPEITAELRQIFDFIHFFGKPDKIKRIVKEKHSTRIEETG